VSITTYFIILKFTLYPQVTLARFCSKTFIL